MIEANSNQTFQRFLFIRYADLAKNNIRTFFKIADEIMVFLDTEDTTLPVEFVRDIQHYCNRIHWVNLKGENDHEKISSISFSLGQQHRIQDHKIEFAVYSDEEDLDHIIEILNDEGRKCIRIKNDIPKIDQTPDLFINMGKANHITTNLTGTISREDSEHFIQEKVPVDGSGQLKRHDVDYLARKTLDRLIQSGNRPAQVSTLKSYILLNNQEENIHNRIDDIILRLNSFSEIEINEDNIVYNLD